MEIGYENDVQGLSEYLLVARPDPNVCDKVRQEKQLFFDTYKQGVALQNPPHIKIANFHANEAMEETVIRWIQRICSQYKSFPVTLNNYSGFPSHTIYVRIQDHAPFKQLADQLAVIDEYVQSNGYPQARLVYRPHVTIANGLGNKVYDWAMSDYSQKTFHETFMMEELILLKRNNQFDTCKQVNLFRFYPPDTNLYNRVA
ncbi:MAG TPA: 2'-5' RNA ligase family protein [Flavitalea sp.]|nr:2'-5' RNA ligase family protein [Flavitalea sp.]